MVKRKNLYLFLPLVILIGIMVVFFIENNPIYADSVKNIAITEKKEDWTALIYPLFTIGGIITITLTYVGWRKYKGDQNRKKNKDNMVD